MKAPEYLWKQVASDLTKRIQDKNLKNGDRFPSLREVCRDFGVSLITAKRIFLELERAGYIRTVQGRGTFVTEPGGRGTINLILPGSVSFERHDTSLSFLLNLMQGMTRTATEMRAQLNTFTCLDNRQNWKNNGFIIIDHKALDMEKVNQIARNNYVVFYSHGPMKQYSTVYSDAKKGAYLAAKHLLTRGHRRIGLIMGLVTNPWLTPRFEGYAKALRSSGIKPDWSLIKELTSTGRDGFDAEMDELLALPRRPTAIMATNDVRALQILEYGRNHGLKIPRDLAVAGFDNIPETESSNPPLTTVDAHHYRIGQQAVRTVFDMMKKKQHAKVDIIIQPSLIIRKST